MIVITFLGTVSGIPTKERMHPAICIEYFGKKKYTFLFDCGEGTQLQLMKAGISFMDVDAVFITHWHADHFAGLLPLIATMNLEKRKRKLLVYGPEAEKFTKLILSLGYFGTRFKVIPVDVNFEGDVINRIYSSKDFDIFSIPVCHTVPAVAYAIKEKDKWSIDVEALKMLGLKRGAWLKRLKKYGEAKYKGRIVRIEEVATLRKGLKIVYTGDTKPCDNVLKISTDADVLIHDGTFLEEELTEDKAHADVKKAAEIAKKAGVKWLVLTHISRRYRDVSILEEEAKKVFPNTKVACDLMRIILKKDEIIFDNV